MYIESIVIKFSNDMKNSFYTILLLLAPLVFGQNNAILEKVTFLGVSSSTLPARMSEQLNLPRGIHLSVDQVSADSPAAKAGLKLYDVLLQLDDQILVNSAQLKALVRMKKPGDQVELKILRKGSPMTFTATLSETDRPNEAGNDFRYGFRDMDDLLGDPSFKSFDRIFPNIDPSLRDFLERQGFSSLPNMKQLAPQNIPSFDPDNPLHGPHSSGQNNQSFTFSTEQKQITTSDEQGTLEYSIKDKQKYLRATSPDGDVLFDGPVTSEDEREKLPSDLRKRLELLEKTL